MKPFVDFFHRTELSLKCALGRSDKKLLSILKERGQTHYAAADYAGLDGMVEQLFTCKDNGIIPILGFEAFVNEYRPVEGKELTFKNLSTGEIKQAEEMDEEERDLVTIDYPIGLFALDMTGYHNMMSVHNDAQLNGVWKRPRTSMSFLKGHGKGLLAVLRTPDSEVGSFIYSGEKEKALEKMQELLDMFEDVYLSVTIAKDRDLREIGAGVVEFADENGFKVIPVVNSHYLRPEDEKTWDTARRLAAISRSKGVMPFEIDRAPDMSYHCREEVDEIFSEYVESEAFGEERYEKCQAELDSLLQRFKLLDIDYSIKLPRFENGEERLRKAAWDGFKRLGYDKMGDQYKERLEYELDNITGAGFANYFLIEEEVFDWYRKEKSPVVAVGRGSAAGSLVLNCLGCTNIIDPIESRLLFERFLDAERFRKIVEAGGQVSGADCPDVDSDWATPMHDVVKRHFIDVYGERCTASIGTRGTMKTKAVLKDLARLYDIPQAEINAVTKGIDSEWADNEENEVTVADLEARSPELKALLEKYPDFCRSFEEIRGTVSNWGVHAGGVLITDFDLTDQLPLRKDDDGRLVTCWTEGLSSRELGMMGFIKFDMLAIDQINIIDDTLRLIKQTRGKDIDWTEIPLGDYKALNQLNKHDGICVFQFDTALAAKVTDNMGGVKSFEDLGSLSTLMRPAALQNGFDKEFGLRRAGKSDGYVPDCLKQYLADTYGLPIYQEHIMQIAMALAGFDKVEAYSFMKKVYKGKVHGKEEKDEWRKKFVEGCRSKVESGEIPADYPDRCFDQIMAFLGYGFCKSHALSYSVYSALDLWLKAYYPLEFMCVNLSITDRAKEKKGVRLLDQRVRYCRSIGLKVSPADVRCSGDRWIIRDGGLIAPLSNLKGFGTNDVDAVVRNRPYSSVKEFMDKTRLGASKFDILCLGGALDCFGEREYLYNWYHEFYSKQKKKTDARQLSLFDALEGGGDAFEIKTQLSPSDLKALFLEYNGFSMEEDMLRKHSRLFAENKALKGLGEALKERRTKHCLVLCRIRKVSRFTSRSGSDFVKIEITDGDTDASTVMKAGDHAQHERSLKEGNVVILPIQLDDKDGFYVDDLDRYDLKVVERA